MSVVACGNGGVGARNPMNTAATTALVALLGATVACGRVVTTATDDGGVDDVALVDAPVALEAATVGDAGAVDVPMEMSPVCPDRCPEGRPICVRGSCIGVAQVAVGGWYTCALLTDTTVWCWGGNDQGQLGDGTTTARSTPAPVAGLRGAAGIATGYLNACAWMLDGTARCWGTDLGVSRVSNGPRHLTPTVIDGLHDVVQISARAMSACALIGDGTVRCWGDNGVGQLGLDASVELQPTPARVPTLHDIAQVSVGDFHSCARDARGQATCWGMNFSGQLGDGTDHSSHTPVEVVGLADAAEIYAGVLFSCARRRGGAVQCWGENTNSQLGDGSRVDRHLPTDVSGLRDATQLSTGLRSCALLADTTVRCWGYQEVGPAEVEGLTGVVEVSTSIRHACARLRDNSLRCWGPNSQGQLGDGTADGHDAPVAVVW